MADQQLQELDDRFNRQRAKMLEEHEGRWALVIRGIREIDFFASEQDAIDAGYWQAEGRRFLVKQVLENDRVLELSRAKFG